MFRTLVIVFLSLVLATACTTGKRTTKFVDADGDGRFEQTVQNTDNLSQRTLRFQERVGMANALCTLESNNLANPERRIIAEVGDTKIYSQDIPVFDMAGCIEEALRWGGERLLTNVVNKGAELLTLGAKGYAAVSIAKRVLDNRGVKVENVAEGATVAVGTEEAPINIDQRADRAGDNSTYNTCAGELVEGECVLPASAGSDEEEFIDPLACGLPNFCSGLDSYLAGDCGDVDPVVVSCLTGESL